MNNSKEPTVPTAMTTRDARIPFIHTVAVVMLAFGAFAAQLVAQDPTPAPTPPGTIAGKKILGVADYSKWRTIEGAQISSDGKWVAYTLRYTNVLRPDSKPALHILNLATNRDMVVEHASGASFSPDAHWVVYSIDSIPAVRSGRGNGGGAAGNTGGNAAAAPDTSAATKAANAAKPPRMELRDLLTGTTQAWQGMTSGTFSNTSSHLLMRRRAAGGGGGGGRAGGAPSAGARRGTDVVLYDLRNRRSQFLGAVGDALFNTQGTRLAYSVEAEVKDANGLFMLDLATGATHTLDNDAKSYSRLVWSDDGKGVAVLKASDVEKMRERSGTVVVFGDVSMPATTKALIIDPDSTPNFPKAHVISDRAPMTWSEDNRRVFFGIIPQTEVPDTSRRRSTDSIADVDVWRTADRRIQSQQMIQAEADRNFTYRQAFNIDTRRFVPLADTTMRDIQLSADGRWAVGRDDRAYISDYKPSTADLYRVDTSTGQRTLMLKGQLVGQHIFGIAPDGRNFLYWKDSRFNVYDLETGTTRVIGAGAPSFLDTDFDNFGPRPSFGVQGYTADGKGVIVASEFDLWLLPFDGSAARNLTNGEGAKNEMTLRLTRTQPISELATRRLRTGQIYDLSKPVTLSAFGKYNKKNGYYELAGNRLREIVYDEAAFSTPQRARDADTYMFTRQTFVEFPDLRVSGPDFKTVKKISDANPQQSEYNWGRRILFDFTNRDGRRLQGLLTLPEDFRAGEKRPMIVNFYEKNSQLLYRYSAPSFLSGMGSSPIEAVSRGYITMIPDVYFRTGSSHSDMLEAVEAATKKVIEMGYADPAHIAVNGHSYGGEGAAYIATQSKMFAAVGMGAGVTDLFTDFNQSWGWSYQVTGGSGQNGNNYYLYGQGRWGFSPWDKPEVYYNESAITQVPKVTTPILIMHGTADPTVSFSEGMNFYNALRYNNKEAYMLAYPGEGHGLSGLANRRDLTIRFFQFMDHFLKGAPAPKWMTDEVPYIRKDKLIDPLGSGRD